VPCVFDRIGTAKDCLMGNHTRDPHFLDLWFTDGGQDYFAWKDYISRIEGILDLVE